MKYLAILIVLSTSLVVNAADTFSYKELETLAKVAMTDEVKSLNSYLAKNDFNIPGYKSKQVRFLQQMGKTAVAPAYLFNKCIMTEKVMSAVLSHTLTPDNDKVGPQISVLADVKTSYNKTVWKLTSHMCEASMERFAVRLERATSGGKPLHFTPDTIMRLKKLVFFPAAYGRPSFVKDLRSNAMLIFTGGFLAGAILSLADATSAGVVIAISSLGTSALTLQNSLPKAENALRNQSFDLLSSSGFVKLDLTSEEMTLN